jgi:pyruvate,orthophosphate dikinase
VFDSWNTRRAIEYRKIHNIPHDLGTGVNVQLMVFGNLDANSGTGVGFTRNPATGKKEYYGEYLLQAQGEDVVAGIRTPRPICKLKEELPRVWEELKKVYEILEKHYRDVQDFEFTIESGKLWMLQTRTGKRTVQAAVRIAREMAEEGLINKETAVLRVLPQEIEKLLHKRVNPEAKRTTLAKGLAASPGAAVGSIVFEPDCAVEFATKGKDVILVRPETTPEDIHGMAAAKGILTARGGLTSHAAIVARSMGKPAVVGCEALQIDIKRKCFKAGGVELKEGDVITIDGALGEVILGKAPLLEPAIGSDFKKILEWADEIRKLGVMANADTPEDVRKALKFGAEGIGLCRTEHMFFAPERLPTMQKLILARTKRERRSLLKKLLPMQQSDFVEIFKVMRGLPVIIRLVDPPLHEFLPPYEKLVEEATELRVHGPKKKLKAKLKLLERVKALREQNPMLGLRGCRLGLLYPEIIEMQTRAIMQAAISVAKQGHKVSPEIMIPLVGESKELEISRTIVEKVCKEILRSTKAKIDYKIGTMIELPRACVTADKIAEHADFFSFGSNDLTQTVYGFSRDDVEGTFFKEYLEMKILPENPFVRLDESGVGKLMEIAVRLARKKKKDIELGICGEHGGDPASIEFCHRIGLEYVSCSPFRIPAARLAAAHAALKSR